MADKDHDESEHLARRPGPAASPAAAIDMVPDDYATPTRVDIMHTAILQACESPSGLTALAKLARQPGGYLSDGLRQKAWPVVLLCPSALNDRASKRHGVSTDIHAAALLSADWRALPEHRDEGQVRLDVDRAFVYYPAGLSPDHSQRLKTDLLEIITATLRRFPRLCYFQGFHDIVQVLLLVLGKDEAFAAVASISLLRLRDFMLPSLSTSLAHLELLPAVLAAADPVLAKHVAGTKPFFALGATLTLFAHEVESYADIARLFDFLLAHEAVVAIYLFASIILARRDELLEIPADEPDMLHFTLSKIPSSLDVEQLVNKASALVHDHPPEKLPHGAWSRISKNSVLKTTRCGTCLTMGQGLSFFDAQLAEMTATERRQRLMAAFWAWRKPAGGLAITVLVGLLSIWLQRSAGGTSQSAFVPDLFASASKALAFVRNMLPLARA